ncbi:MAG TPA: fumarate reductase/succinate dehydrogenase flavoprotein subunit, partial [Nocardioides sp.]|nr:fumarate reductase/succinate dehydrogenase flavoprotein subunit [Nocardioides sp.]
MPDTVTSTEASPSGVLDGDYDDAADYYVPGDPLVDAKAPEGPVAERWQNRKFEARLVNPANRRKLSIIIVGTGLA